MVIRPPPPPPPRKLDSSRCSLGETTAPGCYKLMPWTCYAMRPPSYTRWFTSTTYLMRSILHPCIYIMPYIPEPVSVLFIAIKSMSFLLSIHIWRIYAGIFLLYNQNYSKIHNRHKIYIYCDILNNLYIRWPVEIKWNDQYIVLVLAIRVPRQYCYAITYNVCVGGVYISIRV